MILKEFSDQASLKRQNTHRFKVLPKEPIWEILLLCLTTCKYEYSESKKASSFFAFFFARLHWEHLYGENIRPNLESPHL